MFDEESINDMLFCFTTIINTLISLCKPIDNDQKVRRRLHDKVEEIPEDSASKNMHRRALAWTAERPFDSPEEAFDSVGDAVENLRRSSVSG